MNAVKLVAMVLIAGGFFGLLYGGFSGIFLGRALALLKLTRAGAAGPAHSPSWWSAGRGQPLSH